MKRLQKIRPYSHSDIQTLLQNTSRLDRAIILCMALSGPRVGAIPLVRIKDLEPIDKYDIYKITYYPHSKNSRYFSFSTPECRKAIDDYLEYRKRWGEKLMEEVCFIPTSSKSHLGVSSKNPGLFPMVLTFFSSSPSISDIPIPLRGLN